MESIKPRRIRKILRIDRHSSERRIRTNRDDNDIGYDALGYTKPGSMGMPNPQYDIDILKPDGTPCEDGEKGEIVVRVTTISQ